MKKDIHPKYVESTITCACGHVMETHSTVKEMQVNTCSQCHPFYTGKQKLVDSAGRVDRFKKRYAEGENKKKSEVVDAPKEETEETKEAPEASAETTKDAEQQKKN